MKTAYEELYFKAHLDYKFYRKSSVLLAGATGFGILYKINNVDALCQIFAINFISSIVSRFISFPITGNQI